MCIISEINLDWPLILTDLLLGKHMVTGEIGVKLGGEDVLRILIK